VKELLSEGWELHGHPFVDLQFHNGNGSGPTGNLFCQALVRKQVAAEIEKAPVISPPPRPRVSPTFRTVAVFLAVVAGGYLLVESLIFRSGYYARFLEPDSAAGSFERVFKSEKDRAPSHKKEVLIVGSSRMAEGFSAKVANLDRPEDGFRFANCAIPSAMPRAFYYLIRDLDPKRNRYAAIFVPIDDYDDPDDFEDISDRASELHLLINRLRITDILPYTLSFRSWKTRREVFRGAVFTGTVYQLDLADFIEHPTERLDRVKMFREGGALWAYDYNGIERTLAGLNVDYANHRVTFPPGMPVEQQHFLEETFFRNPPQRGRMRAFELRWLGAVADLYRGSKTRIVFFQAPRSPAPKVEGAHKPGAAVDELAKRPGVTIIDRHKFESLERPELFADHVHLNSEGRKVFSAIFVEAAKEVLR
jgi:hypothetical protein